MPINARSIEASPDKDDAAVTAPNHIQRLIDKFLRGVVRDFLIAASALEYPTDRKRPRIK